MDAKLWEKYPLLNTMMKLRMARFNASERLNNRYRWQSMALVVFSIYVLGLSILPKYMPVPIDIKYDVIGFATAFSSVFVVALSAYSAFSEDVVRAKYLHDNAKQVTNIYQEYKLTVDEYEGKGGDKTDTQSFERRYRLVMDSCPYNHDQIDYHSIRSVFEKVHPIEKITIVIRNFLGIYFWPILAFVGPPILVIFGFHFLAK